MSALSRSEGEPPEEQAQPGPPRGESCAETNGQALGLPTSAQAEQLEEGVLLQQVMRFRSADGSETIYATLRGEFAPGERGLTLYVGFCPPFPRLPVVEAEAIEGPAAKVTVAQVQNNGAQIDVELERPALEAALVTIEVAALPATGPAQTGPAE